MGKKRPHEEWRPVLGYEGAYEVSSMGRVRSVDRLINHNYGGKRKKPGRVLRLRKNGNGYMRITLYVDGKERSHVVHRLVCEAFIGKRPDGKEVNHINGVRDDNRAENLEWVTKSENKKHSIRVLGNKPVKYWEGRFGAEHHLSTPVAAIDPKTGAEVARYESLHEAERSGFCASNLCAALNGRQKTHGGFIWERCDGEEEGGKKAS